MKKILFICTGNTCRSPMAECLFNARCKKEGSQLLALSAGVYAQEGSPASDGAYDAMKKRGLSLSGHRAQPISEALLREASLIVTMTPQHASLLQERFSSLSLPILSFSPPIPDPFGGSVAAYQQTAAELDRQISALWKELSRLGSQEQD